MVYRFENYFFHSANIRNIFYTRDLQSDQKCNFFCTIFASMYPPERIYVDTEQSVIRMMIDIRNISIPENFRIKDTEYAYFEALIYAQKELCTISTTSADLFVKKHLGKLDMSRRSFLNYRNSLLAKEWLKVNGKSVTLPAAFDLYKKQLKTSGTLAVYEVVREENGRLEGSNSPGSREGGGGDR